MRELPEAVNEGRTLLGSFDSTSRLASESACCAKMTLRIFAVLLKKKQQYGRDVACNVWLAMRQT
jgi:hypothetical protein